MPRSRIAQILPRPIKVTLFKLYTETLPLILSKTLGGFGFNVSRRGDFYSPLPTVSTLRQNTRRWYRPSQLRGINYDIDEMKDLISKVQKQYLNEFMTEVPPYKTLHDYGFGFGYTPVDALTLYLMIRHIKPRSYVEVGSGLSTYYCHLAAQKNRAEGFPLKITCIEPYPFEKLYSIPDIEVIASEVQDLDVSFFECIKENDVFFIDSSHILRIDGDVPFLYLDVLPAIAKGAYIHIHDIPFPFNIPYPPELWVFDRPTPMFWNEAMVLQAFLAFNDSFKLMLSLPLIRHFDEPFLEKTIPIYETVEENSNAFSSIWLQRVG
jgi:hypothetical protein